MRKGTLTFIVLVLSFTFHLNISAVTATYGHSYSTSEVKEWTFMVYLDADNNLQSAGFEDFLEMASVGSTADVNIVVQMDCCLGHPSYGDWTDCKRFYVTPGLMPTPPNATVSLGELNMGDPNTLVDFVVWTMEQYPANHYVVVLWDHGWVDGVCWDDTDDGDYLTLIELESAFASVLSQTGTRVDIVGFDTCLTGTIEVAYQITDFADVIVFSQFLVPNDGWPYNDILSDLVVCPNMSSSTLASKIVNNYVASYQGGSQGTEPYFTLSAFNLTQLAANVAPAVSFLADRLEESLKEYGHEVLYAITGTEGVHETEAEGIQIGDLYDFAYEVKKQIPEANVQAAAQNVMDSILSARIAEGHGPEHIDLQGLYVYLPSCDETYDPHFHSPGLRWLRFTSWNTFLYSLFIVYADAISQNEYFYSYNYTMFDSDDDGYLDAIRVEMDVDTMGGTVDVVVCGFLIDPDGNIVGSENETWTITGWNREYAYLNLCMPSGGQEGWYDAELFLYDDHGIHEDHRYDNDVAYLPTLMVHDVAITSMSIIKTIVCQGFCAEINVTVENQGHFDETLNATVYANGSPISTTQIPLTKGSSITSTIFCDTTGWAKGNYTISVIATPVPGETDLADNTKYADKEVCVTMLGDVDADSDVDLYDAVKLLKVYGAKKGGPSYDPNLDINGNGQICIYDAVILVTNYGQKDP